jgi:hypothetical protein
MTSINALSDLFVASRQKKDLSAVGADCLQLLKHFSRVKVISFDCTQKKSTGNMIII